MVAHYPTLVVSRYRVTVHDSEIQPKLPGSIVRDRRIFGERDFENLTVYKGLLCFYEPYMQFLLPTVPKSLDHRHGISRLMYMKGVVIKYVVSLQSWGACR